MLTKAIENGHAEAHQMNLPTDDMRPPSESDILRSLWDMVDLYRRNLILLPPHQRKFVWTKEKKEGWVKRIRGGYSSVRPVGGIVTYQIQGETNGPTYINDGSQRIRTTLDYLSNPAHYGDPPERAESIVRNCAMPVQHRLYRNHEDALFDFQLLNFGTHLTAYEFYCGVITYMKNYDLCWEPLFDDIHTHVTAVCARQASKAASSHDLTHKQMRTNYGLIYRFLSKEKGTVNYRANASKVSMEQALSEKLIERRLRILLESRPPNDIENELRTFKRFLDNEMAELETAWGEVKAATNTDPKRGINITLIRWLLDCAIFRRNNEITIDRWQSFVRTVLTACSGTGQFVDPADQRHKITLSLGAVDKLPAVCKMIGSDFYERPERRRRVTDNNGKPGYDESHLVSFAEHGNGPTFLEPAGVNRARGKRPVDN